LAQAHTAHGAVRAHPRFLLRAHHCMDQSNDPFDEANFQIGYPFLRITVLGLANSGKTSLINAYVNNVCPMNYVPTEDPTLYYRAVRTRNSLNGEAIDVLLEIEDVYSSEWRGQDTSDKGKDSTNKPRNFKRFLGMMPDPKAPGQAKKFTEPMDGKPAPTPETYIPLSKGRMAFLIVFDVTDTRSMEEARSIFEALVERTLKEKPKAKPVVQLVANKIDKEPLSSTSRNNSTAAREYVASQSKCAIKLKYTEVSAVEYTRVKRLFRDVMDDVIAIPDLWLTDAEKSSNEAIAGKFGKVADDCTVQ